MPPRYQPTQNTIQRPLQNEILTLNKLLGSVSSLLYMCIVTYVFY